MNADSEVSNYVQASIMNDGIYCNYVGKVSLSWIETRPRLIIADPELIKLILADKNGHIIKPPLNPLVKLLQLGVTTLEGDQWAKRRRLIIPAFHLEKLKVRTQQY